MINAYFPLKNCIDLNVISSTFLLTTNDNFYYVITNYIDLWIFYNDWNIPATNNYNLLVMNKIKEQQIYMHINNIDKLKEKEIV